jgi:two-component system response regulator PilR (NtrC family)
LPQSLALSNFKKARIGENRRRTDLGPDGIKLDKVMTEIEREYILKAMEMANGSKQGAAELLGITVDSLKYRLTKLSL